MRWFARGSLYIDPRVLHEGALQKSFKLTDEQLGTELHKYFGMRKLLIKRLTAASLEQDPKVSLPALTQSEADCLLLLVGVEPGSPMPTKTSCWIRFGREPNTWGDPKTPHIEGRECAVANDGGLGNVKVKLTLQRDPSGALV